MTESPLIKYLLKHDGLSLKANDIVQRELKRITSCGNLGHEFGVVLQNKKTRKIKDVGIIHCKSRWCTRCLAHKEIVEREKLQNTITGFETEYKDDASIGLLTLTLPPLNDDLHLYDYKSLDGFKREADFKRHVMDQFVTLLREDKACSFVRGWFRSEEQTLSKGTRKGGKLVTGNNLNLHFHKVMYMRKVPQELTTEYEMSCFFFMKWKKVYRRACKKFNLKPKPLKEPYEDENGVIRGGVVFLYKQSLSDADGENWLAKYVIKKSSPWTLASEATQKSVKKARSTSFSFMSLISSGWKASFIENAIKMLVLINFNAREFNYSRIKKGRVLKLNKKELDGSSPSEIMKESIILDNEEDLDWKASKPLAIKRKESIKGRGKPKTKGAKSIKGKYNKKKSKASKKLEAKEWKAIAAVNYMDFNSYDKDVARSENAEALKFYRKLKKEMKKKLKKGNESRKEKISFKPGESFLA